MPQKLTSFTLFKNCYMTRLDEQIHFENNNLRDQYFNDTFESEHFQTVLNFVRGRFSIRIPLDFSDVYGYNYGRFVSDFDSKVYYFFIDSFEYFSNGVIMNIVPDLIMTYCQGESWLPQNLVHVDRMHPTKSQLTSSLPRLKANTDTLQLPTYIQHQGVWKFDDPEILIQSAVDLASKFGTIDAPLLSTSRGGTYDHVTSPLNLYRLSYEDWHAFMGYMKDYPWITQNFQSVKLIPGNTASAGLNDTVSVNDGDSDFPMGITLYSYGSFANAASPDTDAWQLSTSALLNGISAPQDLPEHLLRSPYVMIDLNDTAGHTITIEPQYISYTQGLQMHSSGVGGYFNTYYLFPGGYRSLSENSVQGLYTGTFLSSALTFTDFDSVGFEINQGVLSAANAASNRSIGIGGVQVPIGGVTRALETGGSGEVGGGVKSLLAASGEAVGHAFNKLASFGGQLIGQDFGGNPAGDLGGMVKSAVSSAESVRAAVASHAINAPTVREQTGNYAVAINQGIFGIHYKVQAIDAHSWDYVKRYHGEFGFQWGVTDYVRSVSSWTVASYVKFNGHFLIRNIDPAHMKAIKTLFEQGVIFYNVPQTGGNPFNQDLADNVLKEG